MVKIFEEMDRKVLLSTLWIFALFNYLYCDVLSFFEPGIIEELMKGSVGGMQLTQGFLLGASILMEIPIAMVILSRVLKYRANRYANIIAGSIMTLVQISSLFVGTPTLYYSFFSVIEISTTVLIVWLAWNWHNPEGK
jgi:hypothetical protein